MHSYFSTSSCVEQFEREEEKEEGCSTDGRPLFSPTSPPTLIVLDCSHIGSFIRRWKISNQPTCVKLPIRVGDSSTAAIELKCTEYEINISTADQFLNLTPQLKLSAVTEKEENEERREEIKTTRPKKKKFTHAIDVFLDTTIAAELFDEYMNDDVRVIDETGIIF